MSGEVDPVPSWEDVAERWRAAYRDVLRRIESGEGRDWIGRPDGTLVYWQAEADAAREKLDAVEAEVTRWEQSTRLTERGEEHLRRMRAILRGDS